VDDDSSDGLSAATGSSSAARMEEPQKLVHAMTTTKMKNDLIV
jgi:hypothetical protein